MTVLAERELGGGSTAATDAPPLRVLVVTNMWPTESNPGYGVFVQIHVGAVVEQGVSVRVHFINGRATRWAYARSALRMLRLNFGAQPYDLVHAQSGYSGAVALLQRRVPVLVSFMGSCDLLGDPDRHGRVSVKSRVETALFRRLARAFDATITMTAEMERTLPPRARSRNTVLPHGVDNKLFMPISQREARERLGWPTGTRIVLFVGTTENKRFDLASRAVAVARSEIPDLQLKRCAGVAQREVPLWMNAADVLIVTSNVEGSPNMVKEAMACNLPIVSVDVGDVPELIAGTRHCRVVPRDPEALAAGLIAVVGAGSERSDGRGRIDRLALPVVARRLIALYRQTAEDGGRGGTRHRIRRYYGCASA